MNGYSDKNWSHQSGDVYLETPDNDLIPFRFNISKFTGILQTMYSLQTHFRDFAGSDYHNKVSNTYSFGFSVHMKLMFTSYSGILSV